MWARCGKILPIVAVPDSPTPSGRERIETVRRVFEAFARRDVDAALTFIHAHVRLWVVTAAVARGGRPYIGHEGIRQYFEDANRLWQALELSPIEFEEVGEAIVVLGEVRARGVAGELRQPAVWTWTFRDGLVLDCRVDSDVTVARAALGESTTVEQLVHTYVAAFNRRDVDEMITLVDPAIVNRPSVLTSGSRDYLGHQGLRNWMRDVVSDDAGQQLVPYEVRKLEDQRWALLGEVTVAGEPISPVASLLHVARGLIIQVHEYRSEESLLSELRDTL